MKIWMVAREYSIIAESGGVKNVVCSLSEELAALGNEVTCFLPLYGCSNLAPLESIEKDIFSTSVFSGGESHNVSFSRGVLKGVKIVLVASECFLEKQNVYTYSSADMERFPNKNIGEGYEDTQLMNCVFQKSVLAYGEEFVAPSDSPDIVHCHDLCTATLPAIVCNLRKKNFRGTKFLVTIHNAGPAYHHDFKNAGEACYYTGLDESVFANAHNGERIEPCLLADEYGTLSTVSPWYADELLDANNFNTDGLSQILCARSSKIYGITNGFDLARYSPENMKNSNLPFEFSPESLDLEGKINARAFCLEKIRESAASDNGEGHFNTLAQSGTLDSNGGNDGKVYFCFHGRIVRQKGILLLLDAISEILAQRDDVRFIINGQGERELADLCAKIAHEKLGRVVFFYGYERPLSRLFIASSDFALMPSDFEPCGTEDYIAQSFGTLPVAHATGGLNKIIDAGAAVWGEGGGSENNGTGFLYAPNTADELAKIILRLADTKIKNPRAFDSTIQFAAKHLRETCSWRTVAKEKYEKLYEAIRSDKMETL